MSSRIVIKNLKFCTSEIKNLQHAISLLNMEYSCSDDHLTVADRQIKIAGNAFYMSVATTDAVGIRLFGSINSKLADVEAIAKSQELARLERERANAEAEQEGFRIRRIKAEEEALRYEKEKLELEKQSYIQAKKQSIIDKAKGMGYSVEERVENGAVKLKLIKRVY